jgi:hypothetical protein
MRSDGQSNALSRKRIRTKYPGIRPEFSDMGTKINGQNAAPTFQLVVAQYRVGKFSCEILNSSSIYAFPAPYAPAGRPNKIDLIGQHMLVNEGWRLT